MLLEFIPNPDAVLRHKVAALKPGGWLLFEGMDYSNWLPGGRQLSCSAFIWARFNGYRLTLEPWWVPISNWVGSCASLY